MVQSRSIIIAGAGIGGLTAALALTRAGYRAVVLEQAKALEEVGAGVQLSPNATRILLALGLGDRLRPHVVTPQALRVIAARSGDDIVRLPFGSAEARYGAPHWVIHRADLQAVLAAAIEDSPDVTLRLGARVEDFALHRHGVTVAARGPNGVFDERGIALIGADGLWSALRARLGDTETPRFAQRTAWRATVSAESVAPKLRTPMTHLWLGRAAHLVHYPVKGGALINIVAIIRDQWRDAGWSVEGNRDQLIAAFARFAPTARALIALPERWQKWALFDRAPRPLRGDGPVTLLGDAAHPMLPFLAQGSVMAIEDAAVLARCLSGETGDMPQMLRAYEQARRSRVARAQREARRNSAIYHMSGPLGLARDLVMRTLGSERLLRRYDWLYGWSP